MTDRNCDICCGRGKVRLPVYQRLSIAAFAADICAEPHETSREYPCPECSEVIPIEQLHVMRAESFITSHYESDPKFIEHVKHSMACELANSMVENELVKFERGPVDDWKMRFGMRLTVGVASKKQTASVQERVEQHQTALAREVMVEAQRQINNWGSHYGSTTLYKSQACDSLDGALKAVLDERAKWKSAQPA